MSQPPSVACIVLSYQGKALVLQTLESLYRLDYPRYRVVVVDNGSSDGTYEAVAAAWPQATLLRVEHNQGISVGLNLGIRHVLEAGDDYLLLLNNDIEVRPDMVTELVAVAESDPSIGAVGPKAYYYSDRNRIWSAGGQLHFRQSITDERGNLELDSGQYERTEEMDYVNGCAMLVPRRAQLDVGLWDGTFLVSVEDADWCMRAKKKGWRCFYAHRAVLWHMVSPTTGGYKPGRTFQTGRSTMLFVRKHANLLQWASFLFFFLLAVPAAYLRELRRGNQAAAVAKLRGAWDGFKTELAPAEALEAR
jgi:GT2 family glycosyltransferase